MHPVGASYTLDFLNVLTQARDHIGVLDKDAHVAVEYLVLGLDVHAPDIEIKAVGYHGGEFLQDAVAVDSLYAYVSEELGLDLGPGRGDNARAVTRL